MFFYPDLPISRNRHDIIAAINSHSIVIVVGETGSGKTTQLPKIALEAYHKRHPNADESHQRVGCTQPRRIAAASVAKRVAEECRSPLGEFVGYQVRFEEKATADTRIKFMTDGILLAETQNDPLLRQYHTLIIDEAHERSLNIDFLLGYLKLLVERRSDLKVIISSATLDAVGFADFFTDAPILHIEGRTFPVEMHYLAPTEDEELPQHIRRALRWISDLDSKGDVLIFLPGEREIRETTELLEGQHYANTLILPLYARLGLAEQQRVFTPHKTMRRVVLATNVAETSLTIPGIIYVIDSGLARISRYSPARQIQRLQIEPISQASARQRAGRCGRVSEGICIRLYDEEDWKERPEFTDPEIRRSALAAVILRMKALGLPELTEFPLPDPPSPKLITEGYRTLRELSALDKQRQLTPLGRNLAKLPVDPRLGRMILQSQKENCVHEALILIAGLSIMDPRERPQEVAQKADNAHRRWKHEDSDFLTLLNLWHDLLRYQEKGQWKRNALRKYCRETFLNYRRVLEWSNLYDDLSRLIKDALKLPIKKLFTPEELLGRSAALHRMILSGVPRQFGLWNQDERIYEGANGQSFALFPGSALFGRKKRPQWVMGVELVETTRLWMRRCALLEPEWVEEVAPHLCEAKHAHAHWDEQQGAVYATERIVCGGLVVVDKRRVHFGRIAPDKARAIFIEEGLLGNKLRQKTPCLEHLENMELLIREREIKVRKIDQLWCQDAVLEYYQNNIPAECFTAKWFYRWYGEEQKKDTHFLLIPEKECVYSLWNEYSGEDFPDKISLGKHCLDVFYEYAPGEEDDGITLGIPLAILPEVPDWFPDWGIWGTLAERVELLFRALPKEHRLALHPMADSAHRFVAEHRHKPIEHALIESLVQFTSTYTHIPTYKDQFDLSSLPPEWQTKISILNDQKKEIGFSRNIADLKEKLAPQIRQRFERNAAQHWSATGMTQWTCDTLPESIILGNTQGYPALVDEGETVGLKIFHNALEAAREHRGACVRLARLRHGEQIAHLRKRLPLSMNAKLTLSVLGKQPNRHIEDIISLSIEGGLGKTLPRSAKSFAEAELHLRQNLFTAAQFVGECIEVLVHIQPLVQAAIDEHAHTKFGRPIAEDLSQHLDWLLRAAFLQKAGYYRLPDLVRYAQGLMTRLKRIPLQPIAKELERIQKIAPFWNTWRTALRHHPQSDTLENFGFLLEEFRLSLFSPGIPVKGKISEKRLTETWEGI